jgi:hypothetical protein
MKKVFAVLFFLVFLCGCMDRNEENIPVINSVYKNNSIYSAPGDFDGDHQPENLYITEDDNRYYLNLIKSGRLFNRELGFKVDSLNSFIQDINNDSKEELVLNVIQDNCENCYVFAFSNGLHAILSPEIIARHIDFEKLEQTITYNKKDTAKEKFTMSESAYVKLYYTEMEYGDGEPIFVSEGAICRMDQSIFNIKIFSKVNKNNQITLSKVQVNPLIK